MTRAWVEYYTSSSEGEEKKKKKKKQGYASAVGPINIFGYEEYRIKTGNYNKEWSLFAIGASFPIFLPMFVWYTLSSANDRLFRRKKA